MKFYSSQKQQIGCLVVYLAIYSFFENFLRKIPLLALSRLCQIFKFK